MLWVKPLKHDHLTPLANIIKGSSTTIVIYDSTVVGTDQIIVFIRKLEA